MRKRERLKRVDNDTIVVLVNNTHGSFSYSIPGSIDIVLREYGETIEITHGELKRMMSKGRKFFNKFVVVIQEIITDDDEISLLHVLKELRLEKAYQDLIELDGYELDREVNFIDLIIFREFIEQSTSEEIAEVMNDKGNHVRFAIAEYAASLHKEGELNDFKKMKIIATALGHNENDVQQFWSDIERAGKPVT